MILKYQTLDGAWRVVDGVTECITHGYVSNETVHQLAEMYDGHGVTIHCAKLPVVADYGKSYDEPGVFDAQHADFYLVLSVRGQRQHWRIPDLQQGFLMSDDGKTIDRLLK